ncbi:hypothetical protein [Bacillus weihaiensis]|nr:hypothetical protein [Bacillus weihaiensis]
MKDHVSEDQLSTIAARIYSLATRMIERIAFIKDPVKLKERY